MVDVNVAVRLGTLRSGYDLVPDLLGWVLLAVGLNLLVFSGTFAGNEGYEFALTCVSAAASVGAIWSVVALFVSSDGGLAPWALRLFWFLGLVGTITFCMAMHWLSTRLRLVAIARNWAMVLMMLVIFDFVPLLIRLSWAPLLTFGSVLEDNWLVGTLLRMPPLILLFWTISRMARALTGGFERADMEKRR